MGERREERFRFATNAEVNLFVDGETCRLQLHNVSTRGCMTDAPTGLLLNGRRVAVEFLDDIRFPAQVMWQRGSFAGLLLLRPLASALIWYLSSRSESMPDDRYLPLDRFGRPLASLPVFPSVLRTLRNTQIDSADANANGREWGARP